jgi:starch-binding outer membrane protein, SusD/RagB family
MRTRYLALAFAAFAVGACNLPNDPNLNGPSVTDYSTITSLAQVQNLVSGVLSNDRFPAESQILEAEVIGRDAFVLTASEFRYESELLGPTPGIDASGFLGVRVFPYATIRLANIGVGAVNAAPSNLLSAQDKAATLGYLQTIKALLYIRILETRDTVGAPIQLNPDPTAPPDPLHCRHDVQAYVVALLDSGATNLAAAGAAFPFALPPTFAGFDAPATFLQFNRGLAAKANVYLAFRGYAGTGAIDATALTAAQTALTASFIDSTATSLAGLERGPSHGYSTNTGDATNSLFDTDTAATTYVANPRVRSEAETGDLRVTRKTALSSTRSVAGETSNIVFLLYRTPTSPTLILSNKELLLLQAEVLWGQGNYAGALAWARVVRRNDGGLLTDTTTAFAPGVLNRILYEKRYSLLWQSGDRWVDARMFGKLNGSNPPAGLGLELTAPPLNNMPIPQNEINARGGNLTLTCNLGRP